MAINLERFKKDLQDLRRRGSLLECSMIREMHGDDAVRKAVGAKESEKFDELLKEIPLFKSAYENWYSECVAVLKQLLPDRLPDFKRQYEVSKGRKSIAYDNYVIEDYMITCGLPMEEMLR